MSELYEFINPSDCITFYADNDDYARATNNCHSYTGFSVYLVDMEVVRWK